MSRPSLAGRIRSFLLAAAMLAAGGTGVAWADDLDPDWPQGPGREEAFYLCSACHSLAIVKQQGLSRESWDELLVWMVEEQGMDELEPDERVLILDFLAANFGIPD